MIEIYHGNRKVPLPQLALGSILSQHDVGLILSQQDQSKAAARSAAKRLVGNLYSLLWWVRDMQEFLGPDDPVTMVIDFRRPSAPKVRENYARALSARVDKLTDGRMQVRLPIMPDELRNAYRTLHTAQERVQKLLSERRRRKLG